MYTCSRPARTCERTGQHLDGHSTVEPHIPRAEDLTHAAGADGHTDLVRTKLRADSQRA